MDLDHLIRNLRRERKKLDELILAIEGVKFLEIAKAAMPARPKKRRGRKSMGEVERQEVSRRMKEYWARRRESRDRV
jgi:hypothetical protein